MDLPRVAPVFIRAREIPNFKTLKEVELCESICLIIEKQSLLGVQRIGMVWRVYLMNNEARITLLANNVVIREQRVCVFTNNPVRAKLALGETDENVIKITVKDLPLSKGVSGMEQYLIAQGIHMRGGIEYAKARNDKNELTDWLNGDRTVFVDSFSDPLPRVTWIGDSKVRIFHRGQPKPAIKCTKCQQETHFRSQCTNEQVCVVCKLKGHNPGDVLCNGTAKQPHKKVTAFAGKEDPLSNFFPCDIKIYGLLHRSAEHAYQYTKAQQAGKDKIAERILHARSAYQAKQEAKSLPYNPNWGDRKEKVMAEVVAAKFKTCREFQEKLLSSDKILAECVPGEMFWATGLSTDVSLNVKKSSWPGRNIMGRILSDLRDENLKKQKQNKNSHKATSQRQSEDSESE